MLCHAIGATPCGPRAAGTSGLAPAASMVEALRTIDSVASAAGPCQPLLPSYDCWQDLALLVEDLSFLPETCFLTPATNWTLAGWKFVQLDARWSASDARLQSALARALDKAVRKEIEWNRTVPSDPSSLLRFAPPAMSSGKRGASFVARTPVSILMSVSSGFCGLHVRAKTARHLTMSGAARRRQA